MIDYSVFMMGNPMDVDAAQKAYAKAQVSEIMPFSQFVKHIADHNGVFTRGTVKGVIADMCECLVEMLLEGKKVQLAELGNFWISIGSEGAEDLKKFTESNITAVNIVFTPGEDFQNLRSRATFNPVASRIAQAATLKAEKAGKGTVDLDAAKGKTSASTNENNPSLFIYSSFSRWVRRPRVRCPRKHTQCLCTTKRFRIRNS